MIAWVEGILREKSPTRVVVDVSGVGYELSIPLSTVTALPDPGEMLSLSVHTHVREDVLQLDGFATPAEREAFHLLLRASRVGPRLAQTVLSGIAPGALVAAICRAEVKVLREVPGIGAKMAERMVVELREAAAELEAAGIGASEMSLPRVDSDPAEQALSALLNLGYPRARAERTVAAALAEAGEDATIETVIRAALQRLGS